jgi:photosystem II stability/assembly factor-like uncharacterized protein
MKKKRNGLTLFCSVVLVLGLLAACGANVTNGSPNVTNDSSAFKPGTIYSINSSGRQVIVNDTGNSYSIDKEGHVFISYRNGEVTAQTLLKLDMSRDAWDRGISSGGFFISEDKTAIVYNPEPGNLSPLHVLISDDMGETWNDTIIQGAKGDELFIGFTSKTDGWMTSGASHGVGRALNYVFQTADGGKTWKEVGNPNDVYSEHLTGAGFSNKDIGFLGFRYYRDAGPEIYWTMDQGASWKKLEIKLPEEFNDYNKTPLSPIFNGKEGLYPILLTNQENGERVGIIYFYSKDEGLTWGYDGKLDNFKAITIRQFPATHSTCDDCRPLNKGLNEGLSAADNTKQQFSP